MMKNKLLIVLATLILFSCSEKKKYESPVDYINPLIGTGGHGHTYPGATVPFGMVQLSPDTRKDSWDGCSGYHYSDRVVFGFSHTHLSGTGVGDYGDIRFMPMVGELKTEPGYKNHESGYGSYFTHGRETANAGFYAVHLNDYNIYVGLTATERAGFHKYLFPSSGEAYVLLDLKESVTSEKIIETSINIVNDTQISGLRRTDGWSDDQYVYFYAEFSKPFNSYGLIDDTLKAWFNFDTEAGEIILLKVGISAVDINGAKNNLYTEIPDWNFEQVKESAQQKWAEQLTKIDIAGGTDSEKEVFYTALYHTMLAPNIYSDVDGRYRGHDLEIHQDESFTMYTIFSLWDTFRTLHPLFAVIERERTVDLIKSMLDMYLHDNLLPVWELAANETNCMIGYHAVPVIVDAYKKGITGFDAELSLEAMQQNANANQFGLEWYRKKGYIPSDKDGSSVSKTMEYAYDDWCIAEMANMLGKENVRKEYLQRAQYYKNIYDPETGFFRGKSNGSFVEPFDPTEVNFMLTEANTWQYNFFVPQDINTHIDLLGGDDSYEQKLDELFTSEVGLSGRHQSDITGLIGQYAHGNEPSHHMVYLYNYIGKPWKSQKLARQIMDELYSNLPDGLSGNEDCGQMSAWFVMSAMGFYPVTPGTDVYVLGTPKFDTIRINLENGNTFKVRAKNLSDENYYVQSVSYNGKAWLKSFITHDMIMDGGVLEFEMGNTPNKDFGFEKENRPVQQITDYQITANPYFKSDSKTFETSMSIEIHAGIPRSNLRWGYHTIEDEPVLRKYKGPIAVEKNSRLVAVANLNGKNSFFEEAEYVKMPSGMSVKIKNPYSSQYTAGGDIALINTLRGGENFTTGNWQGYYGVDLDVVIDLGNSQNITEIGATFLQDQNSWIFMPRYVDYLISTDGEQFTRIGQVRNDIGDHAEGGIIKEFITETDPQKVRYIKVFAKSIGKCPDWHKGAGNPAWIFVDEVWWE